MPISYKLPKLKDKDDSGKEGMIGYEGEYPDSYDRRIRVPLSKEQVEALNVGDDETVVLKGTVEELENVEKEKGLNRTCATLMVSEVEVAAGNEFEKLAEDED